MYETYEIIYSKAGELRYTYAMAHNQEEAEIKSGIPEGSVRSVYPQRTAPRSRNRVYYRVKKMDELEKFCLPPDIQSWIMRYDAGSEQALVKQVPLTEDNITMIDRLAGLMTITRRYRGPRHNSRNFTRDCPKKDAERVSVYLRERVA
jgi:hypothetical protein